MSPLFQLAQTQAPSLIGKLGTIWPELALMIGAVVCLLTGLSKQLELRRLCSWVAFASIGLATLLICATARNTYSSVGLAQPMLALKLIIAVAGLLLLLVNAYVPSQIKQCREAEASDDFEPGDTIRGEFYFFFLMSLAGALLCTGADDLGWLFLAIELVGLPTYVMVATARDRIEAQESGVKYFFLGALSAAIFLYGFAMIYGATGHTDFVGIRAFVEAEYAAGRGLPGLMILGILLSVGGIAFKIAAFPMHFYAADVYQGATTAVTGFLAVIPKAAGFAALALLLGLVADEKGLPDVIGAVLAGMAVVTMCAGNFLGLIQRSNVKRILAYSSVAHSGYLILGLLAIHTGGIAAMVIYIAAYASATIAAMAVLALLQVNRADADGPQEAEQLADLAGLAKGHPALASVLALSMVSLIGLPPLFGFFGKLTLFAPAIQAGFIAVVVIAVLNSAVSAAYYLRIAIAPFTGQPQTGVSLLPASGRRFAVGVSGGFVVVLGFVAGPMLKLASEPAAESSSVQSANETAEPVTLATDLPSEH